MADDAEEKLSSLERLLMGLVEPVQAGEPLHSGSACPQCGHGGLEYNGRLQLECPQCGFVSAEGAGCT